jgi:hypothetical protein
MLPFVLSLVLSQAVPASPPPAVVSTPSPWGAPLSWKQGERTRQVWVSPVLVAEPSPTTEGAAAVRRLDADALVVAERPTMRLWRVKDAVVVRCAWPAALSVVNDLPSTASRARVPVGLVCGGAKVAASGLAVLERAAREPGCTPDFWTEGHTR